MSQVFAYQLGLAIQKTSVRAQKIDGTTLETYRIVVSNFFESDKDNKERIVVKSVLLADVKLKIVFEMPFLTISNANIDIQARNL